MTGIGHVGHIVGQIRCRCATLRQCAAMNPTRTAMGSPMCTTSGTPMSLTSAALIKCDVGPCPRRHQASPTCAGARPMLTWGLLGYMIDWEGSGTSFLVALAAMAARPSTTAWCHRWGS